ncbi:zf-HC2 domain-containing protein [Dactylosporangium vinaceum]|uniref:Zf-HC2 domain-containing protein n=1 Tax=Dactylosporangium vinaceum TaxID=53362 RepID=A0ABV5M7G0_9ACTN|nr:zf-HC2 domain-containing protein [Dactylosporangium vinaceum]UAB95368.1 zf-HC2 domain-containing protein [Dactylosporangium vinaceum]
MECERYREALSARLDGEDEPIEPALTDAHLAACPACRTWEHDAMAVTRLVRLQPLPGTPPPVPTLLAGFKRGHRRLVLALRVLLGVFGLAQFMLGIAQAATAASTNHLHGSGHVFHESAAWNVAIGAGFAWIATRRATPSGALPMLTAFVALLVLLSASDLMNGTVETTRLISHGFVLAGYGIVLALSRPALDPGRPPANRQGPPWQWRRPAALDAVEEPAAPAPSRLRLIQGQARADSPSRRAA